MTEDQVFEMAEQMVVPASKSPAWVELHKHFNKLAHDLENPGFRHRPKEKIMSKTSQILAHLKGGHSLTPLQALLLYGTLRLAPRIHEFRKAGYEITTTKKFDPKGSEYAEYKLARA